MDDNSTNPPAPTNQDDVQDKAVEVSQGMVDGQSAQPAADMPAADSQPAPMPEMPAAPAPEASSTEGDAPAPMSEPAPEAPAPEGSAMPSSEDSSAGSPQP